MKRMRLLWLALAAPLLLWGGVKIYYDFFYTKPAPQQVALDSPQLLVANLPFAANPRALAWSPNGKYIALGGSIGSLKAPKQIRQGIAIVSVNSRRVASRIVTSWFAAEGFKWGSDGRLRVIAGDGWDIYAPPFREKVHVAGDFPHFKNAEARENFERGLALDSRKQLTISAKGWDKDAEQAEFQMREKRLLDKLPLPERRDGREFDVSSSSSDGSALALTVSGWIAYEQEGAEELWIFDFKTRKLRLLHEGKSEFGWDNAVQSVRPQWTADGKTILFGDGHFGIEEVNVASGESTVVLESEWAGRDVKLSASEKWLGFVWEKSRNETHEAGRIAVANRDGTKWCAAPQGDWLWQTDAWDWHPKADVLAWAARKSESAPCDLYIWRVQEEPTARSAK